jgi:hypothetical protein
MSLQASAAMLLLISLDRLRAHSPFALLRIILRQVYKKQKGKKVDHQMSPDFAYLETV